MLTVKNRTYLPSTNSPKLTSCSSLSKDWLSDGSGVATMLSRLKSTHAFKQELSSGLEWTILTQDLLILPLTMGLIAISWVLVVERQNDEVKHYVSHSLINYCSGVFARFLNKTQRFLVWPFQISHMWYFWILSKACVVYALSLCSQNMWYLWN